uniref:Uncharacterized protein n=1 Tax=Strombidium rassoulzadegani TaxID=1082188 RepID=A0A7S3CPP2_9SPIT|mmetsp:Transcript_2742/g.4690  ORF Transcript_2742/g.4690 Transcript_2742/m.4690 type:complete len:220 (+) Transcript_2742:1612-2271(+)
MLNIYFLGLLNSSQIQGNIFTIGILFGLSECFGVIVGEPIIEHFDDYSSIFFALTVVVISSSLVKVEALGQTAIYVIFLVQVCFIGLAFNIYFVIVGTRINQKLLTVSFELNSCTGQFMTLFCPIISKLPEPYPTMVYWGCSLTAFLMVWIIGPMKRTDKKNAFADIERSILTIIKDENEGESFKGNPSSMVMYQSFMKSKIIAQWKTTNHPDEEDDSD